MQDVPKLLVFSEEYKQWQELQKLREDVEALKAVVGLAVWGYGVLLLVLLCVAAYWFLEKQKAKKDDGEEWNG